MKKFIVPIINLVSLILASVVFGLGSTSIVKDVHDAGCGNWYQLVWDTPDTLKAVAVVGFFLFCVAVFFTLFTMIPFPNKLRVPLICLAALMFVGAGIMFILTPDAYFGKMASLYSKTDSFIAMIVLVFVAGGLELLATLVSLLPEKK